MILLKGDTLYFSPSVSAGIQKKNVPRDSCYLYTALLVKSPAFLEEKVLRHFKLLYTPILKI